jgi:hypothetical protein
VSGEQICSFRLHCGPFQLPVLRISSSQIAAAREQSAQAGPHPGPELGAVAGTGAEAGALAGFGSEAGGLAGSLGSALGAVGALAGNGSRSQPYPAGGGATWTGAAHPQNTIATSARLMRDTPCRPWWVRRPPSAASERAEA